MVHFSVSAVLKPFDPETCRTTIKALCRKSDDNKLVKKLLRCLLSEKSTGSTVLSMARICWMSSENLASTNAMFFWAWPDFGLRNGPYSTFDSPMRDIAIASVQFVHQHDMCDDLARATEAQDGKKNASTNAMYCSNVQLHPFQPAISDSLVNMSDIMMYCAWGSNSLPFFEFQTGNPQNPMAFILSSDWRELSGYPFPIKTMERQGSTKSFPAT